MKKFMLSLTALVAAVAVLVTSPKTESDAQLTVRASFNSEDVLFVSDNVNDDTIGGDTDVPVIQVKYVGSQESGTVDLNSNALEFFSGALGSEALDGDSGFDVNTGDVCGSTNDSLDVTDAQCDTPAELVNVINDSGANWVAVLLHVQGDETLATAAEYVDPADAQAKLPGGLGLFIDNSAVDTMALMMTLDSGQLARPNTAHDGHGDIEPFLSRVDTIDSYSQGLRDNPFAGRCAVLQRATLFANTTGAWQIQVRAVRYQADGRRDERLVYQWDATADVTDELLDFEDAPLISGAGETLLIEILDDALVTGRIGYTGLFIPCR